MIIYFLVNKVIEVSENELEDAFMDHEDLESLLLEDEEVTYIRQKCKENISCLSKAKSLIKNIYERLESSSDRKKPSLLKK